MTITIRKSESRGRTRLDWLDSRHSFSFGDYFDPDHHRFSVLRVVNDDVVAPGAGFGMHPHRDMEIVTYVLEGALEHRDSTGAHGVIRPGIAQRMSAGSGIMHSEFNPSATEPAHLLQIWIVPAAKSLPPEYEERAIAWKPGAWTEVITRAETAGAMKIHQDAALLVARMAPGERLAHSFTDGRSGWLHLARGRVEIGGATLNAGDAAALVAEPSIAVTAHEESEVLLFDLPT